MTLQTIILHLDGITAGDYLDRVRDPEPPALGAGLRSVAVDADPLGATIAVTLAWERHAPAAGLAAAAAGFPISAEVRTVGGERVALAAAVAPRLAA